ncbi:hypothetical protein ACIPC1_11410 [Streptomyces sp. NPDC087263]|uniref:hypothetical protein n=1 Tax=Streptomyces sp. NPDC087263 TaxID=3365773 RepID=UPI0038088A68
MRPPPDRPGRRHRPATPVAWSLVDGTSRISVRVPVGATAEVPVSAAAGSAVTAAGAALFVRSDQGFFVYEVPHGGWEFVARADGWSVLGRLWGEVSGTDGASS